VLGCLTRGLRYVLAAFHRLALVGIKLRLNGGLCIPSVGFSNELSVAPFANSEYRDVSDSFRDPKITFGHDCSLAHPTGRQ